MKLDPAALRYLADDHFRVLTAVEMGMRNHDVVPVALISTISALKHGGCARALKLVHKHKLVHRDTKPYVGYRLTTLGYDYLALNALVKRGVLHAVGRPLGVGKEADVFVVSAADQLIDRHPELADTPHLAMKLHRLGRTSFRAVNAKRDYLAHRKSASWIYLSRLAAVNEFAFMCALHARHFPVPRPLGHSRHVVVMELCPGTLLNHVHHLPHPARVANNLIHVAVRLAEHGLVHCDLNEFNVIVDDDAAPTVIDFPQMVSTRHPDAPRLFARDVAAIRRYFQHKFGVAPHLMLNPSLHTVARHPSPHHHLDVALSATGFNNLARPALGPAPDAPDQRAHHLLLADHLDSLHISPPPQPQPHPEPVAHVHAHMHPQPGPPRTASHHHTQQHHEQQAQVHVHNHVDAHADVDVHADVDPSDRVRPGVPINKSLIEMRVRKQRSNQSTRRQMAKRNIVKDSQKRKLKSELQCAVWR